MKRAVAVAALAAGLAVAVPGVASAQEQPPTNCDPFSCLFVIPVGPFEIVLFPNGLGSPPVTP